MLTGIFASIRVEILKVFKSIIFRITAGISCFISLIMGMFMYFIKNPDILPPGLLKTKVDLAAVSADWPSYFGFLVMIGAVLGIILFGFIVSWVFGREYSDKTIKDILVLPTSRAVIVLSKLITVFIWSIFLSIIMLIISVCIGTLIQLPLWSERAFFSFLNNYFTGVLFALLLSPAAAFLACCGRGYLAPVGFVILCMGLANLFANIGLGAYFPWSIPLLYTEAAGGSELNTASYIILGTAFLAGTAGTILHLKYADQY
jgi:ABC-type transport system involved in multi-copper enzyme maturation permease subunit